MIVEIIGLMGFGFSAIFTFSLFIGIYGDNELGWFTAIAALGLFELGGMAWLHYFPKARENQRAVAGFALLACSLLSVFSTMMQLILSSDLWEPGWDEGAWTVAVIIVAVAVNIGGVALNRIFDPRIQEEIETAKVADVKAKAEREYKMLEVRMEIEEKSVIRELSIARRRAELRNVEAGYLDNVEQLSKVGATNRLKHMLTAEEAAELDRYGISAAEAPTTNTPPKTTNAPTVRETAQELVDVFKAMLTPK